MAPRTRTISTSTRTAAVKSAPEKQSLNIIRSDDLDEEMQVTLESNSVQVKVHISPKKKAQLAQVENELHESEEEAGAMAVAEIDQLYQSLQLERPLRLAKLQTSARIGLNTLTRAVNTQVVILDPRISGMTLLELINKYGGNLEEALAANVVADNGPNPTITDNQSARKRQRAPASPFPEASSSKLNDHFGNKKVKPTVSPSSRRPTTSRGMTASASKPKLKPTPSKRDHPDKSQVSPSASTSFLPPNSSFTYTAPAESTSYELEFANALERLKQSIKDRPISERLLLGEKYGVDLA